MLHANQSTRLIHLTVATRTVRYGVCLSFYQNIYAIYEIVNSNIVAKRDSNKALEERKKKLTGLSSQISMEIAFGHVRYPKSWTEQCLKVQHSQHNRIDVQ